MAAQGVTDESGGDDGENGEGVTEEASAYSTGGKTGWGERGIGKVHGVAPTGALEWAEWIMEAVLNTKYDAQKRPKNDAGNDYRKGNYSIIMVQHDKGVKRSCERGTSRKEEMAGSGPRGNVGGGGGRVKS